MRAGVNTLFSRQVLLRVVGALSGQVLVSLLLQFFCVRKADHYGLGVCVALKFQSYVIQDRLRGVVDASGFFLSGKLISLSLLAVGGGGGTSTFTLEEQDAVRPRSSLTVPLTVIGPAGAPAVSS